MMYPKKWYNKRGVEATLPTPGADCQKVKALATFQWSSNFHPTTLPNPPGRMTKAFQKPVLSSSIRSAAEHAYKAVDGNLETQWATGNDSDEQWLWVDLLGVYAVHHVVMVLGDVVPSHFVPGLFGLLG